MKIFSKLKDIFKNEKEKVLYEEGLEKSRDNFTSKLNLLTLKYNKIDEQYFEELEEVLISSDIGVNLVLKLIDNLKNKIKKQNITKPKDLVEILVDEMFISYVDNDILTNKININSAGPTVLLFVGVNGVGKTTSLAKLAYKFKEENKKVMLIAADTFRAGASEQLISWGNKIECSVVSGNNSDPASVIYKGIEKALDEKSDIILIDTAGRLQNKVNLMNELEKINKVITKLIPGAPHETLLVLDATTGQNGLMQAKSFKEITNITGIILTKIDGTAKGGIVISIKSETKIPVKYVGFGEKETDLISFDIEKYIYGLFKDIGENNG